MKNRQELQESLEKRVLEYIHRHRMLASGDKLVVAVSGGADSVCLLHLLFKLRNKLKIDLHAAHLNHLLRGDEADEDACYVVRLAERLDIPVTAGRRDVREYQSRQRLSLEEAAREARYAFLHEVAVSTGAGQVAIGHTSDDHIETILLHLIRGTGTRGLTGLRPVVQRRNSGKNLTIIRPLLTISRQETADYCREEQLNPRLDTSNLSLSPLRNRVRLQLLPLLQSYNPQVTEALLRTASTSADDLAYLEEQASRLRRRIVKKQGDTVILDREPFLKLPEALKRHLLRLVTGELMGSLKDIEARHIEDMMAALARPAGKRIDLPRGLVFSNEYDRYLLGTDPGALSPFPILSKENIPLKIPGETHFTGWRLTATIAGNEEAVFQEKTGGTFSSLPGNGKVSAESGLTACFDLDKTGRQLSLRHRQSGDRFRPLGMGHSKKLGEFMIDARIPLAWRERVPVICSTEHIMWVVGYRIDDRVKVSSNTRKILSLGLYPDTATEASVASGK